MFVLDGSGHEFLSATGPVINENDLIDMLEVRILLELLEVRRSCAAVTTA
jgi:hypothetical protein